MENIIGLACDHGGINLKTKIKSYLESLGLEVMDFGIDQQVAGSVDYPDYARPLAEKVSRGALKRGILVCGSGIGMSIAANRFPRVYATLVHDANTAKLCREHNHSNILCLGDRVLNHDQALEYVSIWLNTSPESRHRDRLNKIDP